MGAFARTIRLVCLLGIFASTACLARDAAPIQRDASPYVAGQFLVATSRIGDPRFKQSVIYMIAHDADGAFGLIINRLLGEGPLDEVLADVGIDASGSTTPIRVHYGGPVEPTRGFVLHGTDYQGPSTKTYGEDIALSTGSDILEAIGSGDGPDQSLLLFGYAGWGPGQLESEFARDSWITAPVDSAILFEPDVGSIWQKVNETGGLPL